jgi:formylglycine-generating enzyme required for sulfatase activity
MAARGGLSGKRFPWGDTITQNQANYLSYWENGRPALPYDLNPAQGYHPSYQSGDYPYTSPAGSFAPNGYGLHDLAGNLWEWCWDWCDNYSPAPVSDPHGPAKGWGRILRGGAWGHGANYSRVTARYSHSAADKCMSIGFQSVLPSDQP